MARSIWTGVISFGLVSVPVGLYSATHEHDVSFHQFEKGTGDRIRYQRVNERTGKEVEYANIVRGADVGGGNYVILEPDELDSIAPGRSRSLDVHAFVDLDEIDPIFYQKTYYLAPTGDETAKTYVLLRHAMAQANRAAIATMVMRSREYLTAIRSDGDRLVLETMFFADEIRDPAEQVDLPTGRVKPRPQELTMAAQLIDSMTGPWNPANFRDTYTDRVNQLIEAKKQGEEVTAAEEAPQPTEAVDLMEALRASVEGARTSRSAPASSSGSPRKAGARKQTTSARKHTAAKKAAPAKRSAPAKKAAPAKKTTSAKKAAPAKKTGSARKAAPRRAA